VKNIIIAQQPASPRDWAKLLVYDTSTDEIFFDRFYNLDKYLPKKSFLVFNNTKVLPARIRLKKKNGGVVEVLFLVNETNRSDKKIRGMVDRKINIGDKLFFDNKNLATAVRQENNIFTFKLNFTREKLFRLLENAGSMPIPPYIKNTPLTEQELRKKYQTIFSGTPVGARLIGSMAAPTASLHFTDRVFKKLEKKGIKKFFITLHVGLGTFAPVSEKNIKEKKLHQEYFEMEKETLKNCQRWKKNGKKLVAVGTTVVRTLESIFLYPPEFISGSCQKCYNQFSEIISKNKKIFGNTRIFIFPPYNFKAVDCLITNFHLPGSSLRLLVEAFLKFKKAKKTLEELYQIAIDNHCRFYSFGDAMLIK
jgi:S-adenosylmethionine:tRNA ribosyltransferase-isomerase